jgi:ABC-2 type transport system permease protein
MSALLKTMSVEARLFLREPLLVFFGLVFPTLLMVVLGLVPAIVRPDPETGVRFIEYFVPSIVVLTLAMVGLQAVPNTLVGYREQGILRRLSVTPMRPGNLLIAHLAINLVAALLSIVLVMVVGNLAFDIPLPKHLPGFALALVTGVTAIFAIGLVVAAIAPTTRAASGIATVTFVTVLFFGGVYVPRNMLPDVITRIGAYVPPGVEALHDGWVGDASPAGLHLLIMALIAVVTATAAAKLFRWE